MGTETNLSSQGERSMSYQKYTEQLGEIIGADLMEGSASADAKRFLTKGIMPDGSKWAGGKPDVWVGYSGDISSSSIKYKREHGKYVYTFQLDIKPGRGGGGGATIDATASNQFFNLAGTDKKTILDMKLAFEKVVNGNKAVKRDISKWLKDDDNWLWRVVGWGGRKDWTKPKTKILGIYEGAAMVDPTRRRWPSGRTEIWVPLQVTVQAEMNHKKRKR